MQVSQSVGISLPEEMLSKIDRERGDIPRSRYLLRILERAYSPENKQQMEIVPK
jgi:metal-responsive CopG/Arc/MetJ family transcriptional regulator